MPKKARDKHSTHTHRRGVTQGHARGGGAAGKQVKRGSTLAPRLSARRIDVHCADTVPLQVDDGQAVRLVRQGDVLLVAAGEAREDALVHLQSFLVVVVLVCV